jgi:DNA-binding NtrC family response regulator
VVLSGDRRDLFPSDFPLPGPAAQRLPVGSATTLVRLPDEGMDFERTVSRIERSILDQALARTRGNKKAAAEMLRLKRTTLSAKLKSLEAVAV